MTNMISKEDLLKVQTELDALRVEKIDLTEQNENFRAKMEEMAKTSNVIKEIFKNKS
jgi:hypothetical protein